MRPSEYKETLARVFADACAQLSDGADAPGGAKSEIPRDTLEVPRDKSRGDFACAAAMRLAPTLRRNPREIAEEILRLAEMPDFVANADIAGAGYINITIKPAAKTAIIQQALREGVDFGRGSSRNQTILLEFVSANPTGPLHIGHGRAAAYGDSLANLLSFAGHEVRREYYVNDAGRQAEILAASVWLRHWFAREDCKEAFPQGAYQGEYLLEVAEAARPLLQNLSPPKLDDLLQKIAVGNADEGGDLLATAMKENFSGCDCSGFVRFVADHVLQMIRDDLKALAVAPFDCWFSEQSMHDKQTPQLALAELEKRGQTYEKDGALWFQASKYGDDKDRVLRRADGRYTYFAADIAYHHDKFLRPVADGRTLQLLNVLGADHHGYVPRLTAAAEALGHDAGKLETALIQFVALANEGQRVKMSTRAGEFVRLSVLIDEIGRDAARYFYVSRKNDQHLDFDLELAVEKSRKNPVFYLQYAHARACSVLRKWTGAEWGGDASTLADANCKQLSADSAAMELCARISEFPTVISRAAQDRAVHSLAAFLQELAAAMHNYYEQTRILTEPEDNTLPARIAILAAARVTLANGLVLLGVSAPETM